MKYQDEVPLTPDSTIVWLQAPGGVAQPVLSYVPLSEKGPARYRELATALHQLAWAAEEMADDDEGSDIRDGLE